MIKPILLGEAPSKALSERWDQPLYGPTSQMLLMMLGYTLANTPDERYAQLTRTFDVCNAVERHEQAYPWTAATTKSARTRWSRFLLSQFDDLVVDNERLVVVCLGRRAASVSDVSSGLDWFDWGTTQLVRYTVIPHPSGLNRLYNDSTVYAEAGQTLRLALKYAREGW